MRYTNRRILYFTLLCVQSGSRARQRSCRAQRKDELCQLCLQYRLSVGRR